MIYTYVMGKRNYNQVCALAVSLDIIGDRWALLIVRELIFGARRYSDLLRGLPGLGTNLLAKRLKELEAANIVDRTKLPPPAASTVYQLTPVGRADILPIVRAMTNYGVKILQYPPKEGDFVPASSTMGALSKFFQPERAMGQTISVQFDTSEDMFRFGIADGGLTAVSFGIAHNPDLILQGNSDIFMALIVGYATVTEAIVGKQLTIAKGTVDVAVQFFKLFNREEVVGALM